MTALTSPYLWYTTRGTGLVTLALLTVMVCLGVLVANRAGGTRVGRFELAQIHRAVSAITVAFLAIHVITTVADSFVATGPLSIVVPMTSPYRRVGVGLGALALDLLGTVWLSSLLQARLSYGAWRAIHWLGWLCYPSALVHALATGTDARHGVGLAVVVVSLASVAGAALWRITARPDRAAGRTALSPPSPPVPRRPERATEIEGRARG